MMGINTPLLESLLVPLPSIVEQNNILQIINKQHQIVARECDHRIKLTKLKTGLLQDLLTGKVSVEPLLGKT